MSLEKIGTWGWVGLASYVIAWDYFAPESLSGAADRLLESDMGKILALGATALVGSHLLNILPEKYDPIHKLAERVKR